MAIYPKAIWKGPAPASNYSPYSQNPGPKICFVTHVIVGSAQSAIGEFLTPGKQLSAHFVVDFDGTIYQILDTNDCAYAQAAGNYPPIAGIAIEFAGTPDVPRDVTERRDRRKRAGGCARLRSSSAARRGTASRWAAAHIPRAAHTSSARDRHSPAARSRSAGPPSVPTPLPG